MNGEPCPHEACAAKRNAQGVRRVSATLLFMSVGLGCVTASYDARADAYGVTHPGRHIDYGFELEPEAIIGFGRPLREGPGLGVRGSIPVLFNGFVPSINNSIAITFGFDKDPFAEGRNYYAPVAMQWNFWLHRNFSVFGEPGILLSYTDRTYLDFGLWGGARLHFSDFVALTGRLSLPFSPGVGVGVSFFL